MTTTTSADDSSIDWVGKASSAGSRSAGNGDWSHDCQSLYSIIMIMSFWRWLRVIVAETGPVRAACHAACLLSPGTGLFFYRAALRRACSALLLRQVVRLPVRLSICDVDVSWSNRLEYFENNFTAHSQLLAGYWKNGWLTSRVCLSVRVCPRYNSQAFAGKWPRIATKLAHDGSQVSLHPGCAQGQGQGHRSRDTGTFVLSRKSQVPRRFAIRVDSVLSWKLGPARTRPRVRL